MGRHVYAAVVRATTPAVSVGEACLFTRVSPIVTDPIAALPVFSMAAPGRAGVLSSAALITPRMATALTAAGAGDLTNIPGFGSVPPKLIKKITAKEYIDIGELLPESWRVETEGTCCHTKRPRRGFVTDINVWTECFATMAAILSSAFPLKAPHFFAYLRTITKASRTFEGPAWASYDMAFRRQAANRGSLDWGVVDAALFSEAFAGRAKAIPRCRYCLADTHVSHDCPHAPVEGQGSGYTAESRLGRPAVCLAGQTPSNRPAGSSVEICRLFNAPGGSRCRFSQCRYAHVCAKCRRPHPAAECGERRPQVAPPLGTGSPRTPPPPPPPPPTA